MKLGGGLLNLAGRPQAHPLSHLWVFGRGWAL